MGTVTGIGGVFLKSDDSEALGEWYRERLGIPVNESGYCDFEWRHADGSGREGRTVWSLFPSDTDYFGDQGVPFMVNYRVDDLDGLLKSLRQAGADVDDRLEEYDYGRFAWITDPKGNRIELWEPAGRSRGAAAGEDPEEAAHTFLFDEATWRAEGCFIDAGGTADPASGVTEVRHGPGVWVIHGEMSVESDESGDSKAETRTTRRSRNG